jgi:hypothetical protein
MFKNLKVMPGWAYGILQLGLPIMNLETRSDARYTEKLPSFWYSILQGASHPQSTL